MSLNLKIQITGDKRTLRVLRAINPETNPEWVRASLVAAGTAVQRNAQLKQIRRGGITKSGRNRRALKTKLTSRGGHGRASISVDRGGLQRLFVDVGSHGAASSYMKIHEVGGTFYVKAHRRKAHTRNGVPVRAHNVDAHAMLVPPRPYMRPALRAARKEIEQLFRTNWAKEFETR